jgi:hypothetical protein
MSQIVKKFIGNDQVDGTKLRLLNNVHMRARNAADSGDISILKVNASDRIEFASLPQVTSDPVAANDLVRKSYVDSQVVDLYNKETLTLSGTDITNQYKDLAQLTKALSLDLSIDGVLMWEGVDFTLSVVGGVTRITFAGDLATAGAAALVAGDVLRVSYRY